MATPEDFKAAIESSPIKTVDGAAEQLAVLWGDIPQIDAALLPDVIQARLQSRAYSHFVQPTAPPASETPGTLDWHAKQFKTSRSGGGGLSPIGATGERRIDLAGGMRSHTPMTHADLPGSPPPQPAPPSPAQTLERIIRERLAVQRQQADAIGAFPTVRHSRRPK